MKQDLLLADHDFDLKTVNRSDLLQDVAVQDLGICTLEHMSHLDLLTELCLSFPDRYG